VKALAKLEKGLVTAERFLLVGLVLVMVVLSFLQVVLRSAFSSGLLWADTFLRHLVLWVGFLGASVAAADDKQFAMDALTRVLKGRLRAGTMLLCSAFTASVSAVLTRASWIFLRDEMDAASILFSLGDLHVPAWLFETILPGGFALLFIHYLIKSLRSAWELYSPPVEGEEAGR